MDGGKVARYTKNNLPRDLPLITDLFAPKEYYNNNNNDPAGALPRWFLSALVRSSTTFTTLHHEFNQLYHESWGFVAEINHYQAMDEQCQMLGTQINLLEQELQTAHMECSLSKG